MRFVEHWTIGKDALSTRRSFAYQLGSILPDWFERKPIHRWKDNKDRFLKKASMVRELPPGFKRDWTLGTLAHYVCDYCCMAHNEEYYRYVRHRIYEVQSQKFFKREHKRNGLKIYRIRAEYLPEPPAPTGIFEADVAALVETWVGKLHERIDALNSPQWYRDERCMSLDIRYAHALLRALLTLLSDEGGTAADV